MPTKLTVSLPAARVANYMAIPEYKGYSVTLTGRALFDTAPSGPSPFSALLLGSENETTTAKVKRFMLWGIVFLAFGVTIMIIYRQYKRSQRRA